MARPKVRAADGQMPYCIAFGQPNTLVEKRYANEAGVRKRAGLVIDEITHWASRHNHDLRDEIISAKAGVEGWRAQVLNCAFSGRGRDNPREFSVSDDYTGVTWVIKMWKEN